MKVIDMLDRIAKGEEVKFKIIETDEVLNLTKDMHLFSITHNEPIEWFIDEEWLNYEVEIIEEQKEETKTTTRESFEALGYACGEIQKCFINGWEKSLKNKSLNEEDKKIKNIGTIYFNETPTEAILHRKIEEIIDYINKEK